MSRLIYTGIQSLDGYTADVDGGFDWSTPTDEVHAFVNDLERPIGTYLYGRRMYDVMRFWETADALPELTDAERDYAAVWQGAEKVVYSSTLERVSTARTRLERAFDPATVRRLKDASSQDISIGGAGLAAEAIRAGLIDVYGLIVVPVVVGGGTPFLPDGVRLSLELTDEHRFGNGVIYLEYSARS